MDNFLKKFNIRKIYKNINIALISTLIGMFMWVDIGYALRPPLLFDRENLKASQDTIELRKALAKIEEFITTLDTNAMQIKDDALLRDAVTAAGDVRKILERIMNGLGGEGVGPAWNSSFHLYIRLAGILKTNAISPDEWKWVKEYFGETKSALASMESAGNELNVNISEQHRKVLLDVATEVAREHGTEFVLLLYGNVARGKAGPDSDVDFSVDVPGETKNSSAGLDPAMDIAGDIFVNLIALGIPTDDADPSIKAKHPEQIIRSYELKPDEYQLYFITPEGYEILNNIGMNELRGLAKSLKRVRDNL